MDVISVIIPVYKVEKYLDKCVESVVNQTYKNLEVILVDDGSPDNCPKMCDEWAKKDDRIKVIHKENGGVSSARNEGIKVAQGEYIAFVDSDDTICSNHIQLLVDNANKETLAVTSINCIPERKSGKFNSIKVIDLKNNMEKLFYLYKEGAISNIWNKLFIKSKIKAMFDETISNGEDLKFVLDYINEINNIAVLDNCTYNYFYHENSLSTMFKDSLLITHRRNFELIDSKICNNEKLKHLNEVYYCEGIIYLCIVALKSKNLKYNEKKQKIKEILCDEFYVKFGKIVNSFKVRVAKFLLEHRLYFLIKLIVDRKI